MSERETFDTTGLIGKEMSRKGLIYYEDDGGNFMGRQCSSCEVGKHVSEYHKSASSKWGIYSRCKKCANDPYSTGRYRHIKKRRVEQSHKNQLENNLIGSSVRRGKHIANSSSYVKYDQRYELLKFESSCALTGESKNYHIDHVIPVSIGHGGTNVENMIPLRGDLNTSKSASHIFEWFDANRERLGLSQRRFNELIKYLADVNEMTTDEYRKYIDWCHDNPRTVDEIKADNEAFEANQQLGQYGVTTY